MLAITRGLLCGYEASAPAITGRAALCLCLFATALLPSYVHAQTIQSASEQIRPISPQTPGVIVLFSGSQAELDQNFSSLDGSPASWPILSDGSMTAQYHDIMTRQGFRDIQLHVEFKVPFMPRARGQQRGNSGVILHGRFEMQILDSYGLPPSPVDCGAIYGASAPLVNACKAPNEWQSYDILYRFPRFTDQGITERARITAFLNGQLIQNNVELRGGKQLPYHVGAPGEPGHILLQFHASPVQFRNIWLLPLNQSASDPAPARPTVEPGPSPEDGDGASLQQACSWQKVPQGQQIPVKQATFDQAGYWIETDNGQTISVPFADQNMYVMKFGRSDTGQSYFVNDGAAPVLYLTQDAYLANAAAQNARWYPLTPDYPYTTPVYVAMAGNWPLYTAMGWYPGMAIYGGLWRTSMNAPFAVMPGYYTRVGGVVYRTFRDYRNYYTTHPGYVVVAPPPPGRAAVLAPPRTRVAIPQPVKGPATPYAPAPQRIAPPRRALGQPAGGHPLYNIRQQPQRPIAVPRRPAVGAPRSPAHPMPQTRAMVRPQPPATYRPIVRPPVPSTKRPIRSVPKLHR